jgi:DNA-directed RNA polymerase subunit RPC12/RpoP
MLIGCLLMAVGLAFIVINPFIGVIPGVLLILIGIAVAILGGLFRTVSALAGGGAKTCPECRSRIDRRATICAHCGHRFE